jgi:hypothetical protein
MLATGLAAAVIFVVVRWDHGGQRLGWQPLTSDARLAIQSCSDRMYNGLYEGGQLIWFVPSKRVFIDGRVEAYPLDFMSRVRTTDLEGDYRQLFTDFDIGCAVTSPQSVLFSRLHQDAAMRLAFNDEHWAVFVR